MNKPNWRHAYDLQMEKAKQELKWLQDLQARVMENFEVYNLGIFAGEYGNFWLDYDYRGDVGNKITGLTKSGFILELDSWESNTTIEVRFSTEEEKNMILEKYDTKLTQYHKDVAKRVLEEKEKRKAEYEELKKEFEEE